MISCNAYQVPCHSAVMVSHVHCSDVICDFPLKDMLAFQKKKGAEGTILVTRVTTCPSLQAICFCCLLLRAASCCWSTFAAGVLAQLYFICNPCVTHSLCDIPLVCCAHPVNAVPTKAIQISMMLFFIWWDCILIWIDWAQSDLTAYMPVIRQNKKQDCLIRCLNSYLAS